MNNSIVLSQILWPLFIIIWISMMIHRNWYQKLFKKLEKAHVSVFVMSIMSFIFWMFILTYHSWFSDFHEWFATIIGIIVTLKSAIFLLTPNITQTIIKEFSPLLQRCHYIWVVYLLIWIYVSYLAYIW